METWRTSQEAHNQKFALCMKPFQGGATDAPTQL